MHLTWPASSRCAAPRGMGKTLGPGRLGVSLLLVLAALYCGYAVIGGAWPALNGWVRLLVAGAAAARVGLILVERGRRSGPYAEGRTGRELTR